MKAVREGAVVGFVIGALLLAGCSSSTKPSLAAAHSASPVAEETTVTSPGAAAPVAAPAVDPAVACQDLQTNNLLKSIKGAVIVAGVLQDQDIATLQFETQTESDKAPPNSELQDSLNDLVTFLENFRTVANGQQLSTSTVQPNIDEILSICATTPYPVTG